MQRVTLGLGVVLGLLPSVVFACDMPTIVDKPTFVWPLQFPVTEGYGIKFYPFLQITRLHPGIDIAAPVGTAVQATMQGRVTTTSFLGDYGNSITIDHGGGWETTYSHLQRFSVRVGDCVNAGDQIAPVGMTGLTQRPHLHFEILRAGRNVDPFRFLPER